MFNIPSNPHFAQAVFILTCAGLMFLYGATQNAWVQRRRITRYGTTFVFVSVCVAVGLFTWTFIEEVRRDNLSRTQVRTRKSNVEQTPTIAVTGRIQHIRPNNSVSEKSQSVVLHVADEHRDTVHFVVAERSHVDRLGLKVSHRVHILAHPPQRDWTRDIEAKSIQRLVAKD